MCLIAFAINVSERWPLVVASNRDEFLDRPTLPLAGWKTASGQEIISARDVRAGGTWLGATPGGRVAFLTNVREPKCGPVLSSRGELVIQWLEGSSTAEEFSVLLEKSNAIYSGFNLVLGDLQRNAWTWLTNRSTAFDLGWQAHALAPGVYGLSNAFLDTPWPKTVELKQVLSATLLHAQNSADLQEPLWLALSSRAQMPLVNSQRKGFFEPMEPDLSSAFVDIPDHDYGTQSSTLLTVSRCQNQSSDSQHSMEIYERTYMRKSGERSAADFQVRKIRI